MALESSAPLSAPVLESLAHARHQIESAIAVEISQEHRGQAGAGLVARGYAERGIATSRSKAYGDGSRPVVPDTGQVQEAVAVQVRRERLPTEPPGHYRQARVRRATGLVNDLTCR